MKKITRYLIGSSVVVSSLLAGGTAFAAEPVPLGMARPAVVGTVTVNNGTTLTVTAKSWQRGTTATTAATTYTVNVGSATIIKDGASSTISAIAVGDTVMVQGTVSGTTVTATSIRDRKFIGRERMEGAGAGPDMTIASHTPVVVGNGQPIIGGTVTAVSGTTLTVTNKSNVTYTVNATSATVSKTGVTGATTSSIAVGDNVVVQGTVNGTSVTASSVVDSGIPSASSPAGTQPEGAHRGFLGAIGGFFSHLFGFF